MARAGCGCGGKKAQTYVWISADGTKRVGGLTELQARDRTLTLGGTYKAA